MFIPALQLHTRILSEFWNAVYTYTDRAVVKSVSDELQFEDMYWRSLQKVCLDTLK